MPGLIDAHCHITFGEPASNDELFFHRDRSTSALVAGFDVQKLLLAGVTGFLDADCLWNLGPALRDAIDDVDQYELSHGIRLRRGRPAGIRRADTPGMGRDRSGGQRLSWRFAPVLSQRRISFASER